MSAVLAAHGTVGQAFPAWSEKLRTGLAKAPLLEVNMEQFRKDLSQGDLTTSRE